MIDVDHDEAETASEIIQPLVKSGDRIQIFKSLLTTENLGPTDIAKLDSVSTDAASTPSTMLNQELHEGVVVKEGRKYRLRPQGEWLREPFVELVDRAIMIDRLSKFMSWVDDFNGIDIIEMLNLLKDADIYEPPGESSEGPFPLDVYEKLIQKSDEIREVAPYTTRELDIFLDEFKKSEKDGEFVVPPDITNTDDLSDLADQDAEFFKSNEPLPDFTLSIFKGRDDGEDAITLSTFKENRGGPYVVIYTKNPEAVAWATDIFKVFKDGSNAFLG